ncbi:hypothetical protein OG897_31080 [Streptomyces sp. NBC_00237]|uniref:hypothetical protein n=1 Tax=Streptomyces sp. NBC_00237 TaxID=2975687 RepID=UPI00224F0646|nr:hypothetical protein [Streptomyces sp. NBC_00237]MCX5205862.1 hypothetical protein [Streptomyces sp. NBC_00237]
MPKRNGARTWPVASVLLSVTVAGLGLAACQSAEPAKVPPAAVPAPAATPRAAAAQELDLLHRAKQILLRDCMRARGFVYLPVPREPVPEARDFPYGIDDPAWAARHGLGSDIDRQRDRIRRQDPNQIYFRALSPERKSDALRAANGPEPTGLTARTADGAILTRSSQGCQAEADRTLYGDLGRWFQAASMAESLAELRRQRVLADPGYAQAARVWSACMRKAGHSYADPARLRAAVETLQPLPKAREVAMALAEARCARSSGLAATAAELDREHAARLRQGREPEADAQRRLQLTALPRARSVVDGAAAGE